MSKSVFVIYDTVDRCLWNHKAKIGWISSGAAKNAWNLVHATWSGKQYFDDQQRYVVIELSGGHISKLFEENKVDQTN